MLLMAKKGREIFEKLLLEIKNVHFLKSIKNIHGFPMSISEL